MKQTFFAVALLLLSASVCAQPKVITSATPGSNAERFTNMFDRTDGWLGADGIYSIPMNGNDNWGSANKESSTFWVFSDTILGTANPETKRYNNPFRMVNHSAAILTDFDPMQEGYNMQFLYGRNADGTQTNLLNGRYWLQDGIAIGNKIFFTAFEFDNRWKPMRIHLVTLPFSLPNTLDWENLTITENFPLFAENEQYQLLYGAGILDHSAKDGYIYVYGYRDTLRGGRKHLVAARVKPESFADAEQWRFWNGTDWVTDMTETFRDEATLAERVSTELSVTPIGNDRYLLVFTQDVMSNRKAYKVGSSPIGPFGETVVFYEAPEPRELLDSEGGQQIRVYNAKAHPHLSAPGLLLISYNVNRPGFLPRYTFQYRPRFIELRISEIE